jgi:hypothetical protein
VPQLRCPHPIHGDGWALLTLSAQGSHWRPGFHPGPIRVRPGRPSRRGHLRLCWPPAPIIAPAGTIDAILVDLNLKSDHGTLHLIEHE